MRRPKIATIGSTKWKRHTHLVPACAVLNSAMALSFLGSRVSVRTNVGEDEIGKMTASLLSSEGINTDWITEISGAATACLDHASAPLLPGLIPRSASLVRGDQIDIASLFGHDVVVFDIDDMPLLRFLVDLPAHTLPSTRLLGTLQHLAFQQPDDALQLLMRHDVVVGTPEQFQTITGSENLTEASAAIHGRMRGENLRAFVVAEDGTKPSAYTVSEHVQSTVDLHSADMDSFTAAIAFGMAARWDWSSAITFATCAANLSIPSESDRPRYPTFEETIDEMKKINLILR